MHVQPGAKPLIILAQAADAVSGENPYTKLLYAGMEDQNIVVHPYSRRSLVALRPDIIHVHWPEFLVRWNAGTAKAAADAAKELALLWLARRRGAKLIWTAHDLGAHDRPDVGKLYARFTAAFNAMVDRIISLSPAALVAVRKHYPAIAQVPADIVPHGHYIGYYPATPATHPGLAAARDAVPGKPTYLIFGQIRRYKNVTGLMQDFAETGTDAQLVIAGEIRGTEEFREEVLTKAAETPGVHLIPDRIADADVWALHDMADVIVLPYAQGSALHSGAAILALSLGKPIVVRDTPTMRDLQAIVGADWVALFNGTPKDALTSAAALQAAPRAAAPDLSALEPALTARQTVACYRAAHQA
ncbi:glycosyl transferases group 1 family protein [Sphingomonas sp. S17]|mgnify:CR=1 FL=1|jgi:glycosyltransferase involved in cell wall biosynthesis|uniref:Glycosyltransferase n=2 Tax=Sphingomonas paucimobilis TaxID=13689 RepID=A0A7Y2PBW8_SPHPI|nr:MULTISPECIES: glycosyltransferase [Sphingomonas]EGI55457.1 glycosyl transferases group 1 family protein [Sphingomonas sp. S17]MCM3680371.1 glycosyltransferase [Sphingomonas paucimobilis]MDG5970514.1 glycosyltransferase [Sphingomonas paucimobilis]NNG57186.1 glycosyltransferase [Sphingomonas paucimobilis]QPS15208.1 glycosyltransferase [Sphingomonas paucimobilis]